MISPRRHDRLGVHSIDRPGRDRAPEESVCLRVHSIEQAFLVDSNA